MPVRKAMSEVYVHQDEQVTTKKAPYLPNSIKMFPIQIRKELVCFIDSIRVIR